MGIRDWLNENSTLATGATVVLLIVALGVVFLQMRGPQADLAGESYYLEVETGEVFAGPRDATPPVEGPSGGVALRADIYSCGECTPEEWIGHVELDADVEAHRQLPGVPSGLDEGEILIRDLDGGRWFFYDSDAAFALFDRITEPCPGQPDMAPEENPCMP